MSHPDGREPDNTAALPVDAQNASAVADASQVAAAVQELLAMRAQGRDLDRDAFVRQHPQIAEELSACLEALDFLRRAAPTLRQASDQSPHPLGDAATADRDVTGVLGDFRILREIGCGGMGIVYEAEQISLGRRVALKVLPFAAVLDPRQLQRFKNEAHAAATLDHPGIVHVYAVGCDRGVHFYAMQYVEGQTLAAIIRQWRDDQGEAAPPPAADAPTTSMHATPEPTPDRVAPAVDRPPEAAVDPPPEAADTRPGRTKRGSTPGSARSREFFRNAADLSRQAASALEYAHQMGVVHRDIKPSNLLVDPHGHLWITDFGLATTHDSGELTLSGDVLGTLRYMSPEQAAGNRRAVDHRTDIYSLGVTLYEMLTLAMPFESDAVSLCRRIVIDAPRPPRRVDPRIPRDLETIVLKAIAKEPQSRYATAGDLADDLRRFLEDRPVLARRPSLVERTAKCLQRHVKAALFAVAGVALAAVLSTAVAIEQSRLHREAGAEAARAEANLQLAMRAVDETYNSVAERYLTDSPQAEPIRLQFLENAVRFYADFAQANQGNAAVTHDTALAHLRLGRMYLWLGQTDESEAAYRRAIAVFSGTAPLEQMSLKHRSELGECHDGLGFLLRRVERLPEARASHEAAIAILEQIVAQEPRSLHYKCLHSHAVNNLGLCFLAEGRLEDAERSFRRSLSINSALVSAEPTNLHYQWLLGFSYHDLAEAMARQGATEEAEKHFALAIAQKERVAGAHPRDPSVRSQLAKTHAAYGQLLAAMPQRAADSERHYRRALEVLQPLSDEFPAVPEYRRDLALCYYNSALWTHRRGSLDQAESEYRKACVLFEGEERSQKHRPLSARALGAHAAALSNLAAVLLSRGSLDEAKALLAKAAALQRKRLELEPTSADAARCLGIHEMYLAHVLVRLRDHANASEAAERSAQTLPDESWAQTEAAEQLIACVSLLRSDSQIASQQRATTEIRYRRRAMTLLEQAVQKASRAELVDLLTLAQLLANTEVVELRRPNDAVALAVRATAAKPSCRSWTTLGIAYYRAGKWTLSIDAMTKANAIEDDEAALRGGHFVLAMAHRQLGDKEQARTWYDRAVARMERSKPDVVTPELECIRAEAAQLLEIAVSRPEQRKEPPKTQPKSR